MFCIVNKKTICIIIAAILSFSAILICGKFNSLEEIQSASALPISGKVVIIDPGHGGFDAGASDNGIEEKEVNLKVAEFLTEYIGQGGGIAIMTRTEDASTADENTKGRSAKKSDLINRRDLAKKEEADVFISIHMNKFSQEQYKGAQVFYADDGEKSKIFGECVQESLKEIIQDGNQRNAKKAGGGIFVLKNTSVPSIIVECGFLSNHREAELLKTEDYQKKLAWAMYVGVVKYFAK